MKVVSLVPSRTVTLHLMKESDGATVLELIEFKVKLTLLKIVYFFGREKSTTKRKF